MHFYCFDRNTLDFNHCSVQYVIVYFIMHVKHMHYFYYGIKHKYIADLVAVKKLINIE